MATHLLETSGQALRRESGRELSIALRSFISRIAGLSVAFGLGWFSERGDIIGYGREEESEDWGQAAVNGKNYPISR